MNNLLITILAILPVAAAAQFPPQAGITGSTAIHRTDNRFVGWAKACDLQRGYMHIEDPSLGYSTAGDHTLATGAPDNFIVSLGDSGIATLTFESPVYNGNGFDFVIFENGFQNPANKEEAFLELAFVEVSSDGTHYTRFPASSQTPDTPQVPMAGVYMNARKLNNLAGKYAAPYGTPFDLEELAGTAGLDIDKVTHIRLVDVIGSVKHHAATDKDGNIINDPYPTPIPTSGFDLDAVGALYMIGKVPPNNINVLARPIINVYPNPVADLLIVETNVPVNFELTDVLGKVLYQSSAIGKVQIPFTAYPPGVYYINSIDSKGNRWVEKLVRY